MGPVDAVKPMAEGRDCEIFDLGDGTVLRRQRQGRSLEREAEVMRHVRAHGFPCPIVHRADGPDLVLDLVDGASMAQDLLSEPTVDRVREAGAVLAELHQRLHRIPPLASPGRAVLHLDLHPENVLMTSDGPVVIDWANAADGPPELDVATTWVILEPFAGTVPLVRELVEAYLAEVGRETARSGLAAAARRRSIDPNVTDDERAAVSALLRREGGS